MGSFRLVKGLNRFCLSHPGVYNLMPKSECHQFAQDVYQFKTSSSFPTLRISAIKHALVAEIHADVETPGNENRNKVVYMAGLKIVVKQ